MFHATFDSGRPLSFIFDSEQQFAMTQHILEQYRVTAAEGHPHNKGRFLSREFEKTYFLLPNIHS